jgi:hypothetical protein
MSTPHRATPDQWAHLEVCDLDGLAGYSCVLELRARIEALESEVESLSAANLSFNSEIEARIEALEAGANLRHQDEDAELPINKSKNDRPSRATDADLVKLWHDTPVSIHDGNDLGCRALRAVYDLGRHHGATCPHIVSSDEGTSYCRLAEQSQDKLDRLIEMDRAKPAPAGSLVERLEAAGYGRTHARAAIREVAAWFRRGDAGAGSAWTVAADVLDAVLQQDGDR